MAGYDNIKDHGFEKRTADERRELAVAAGKKSGESRRKKADFRKTLNALLTAKIDSPEWEPILNELGVDCTLESALNMAMIKKGLEGDVKAFVAIRDTLKTEEELQHKNNEIEKQRIEIEKQKMEIEKLKHQIYGEKEEYESDGFLDALKAAAGEVMEGADDFIET